MSGDKSYHIVRCDEEYEKSMNDEAFMTWLRAFEPAWESEFWRRNIVQMHFAFLRESNYKIERMTDLGLVLNDGR